MTITTLNTVHSVEKRSPSPNQFAIPAPITRPNTMSVSDAMMNTENPAVSAMATRRRLSHDRRSFTP